MRGKDAQKQLARASLNHRVFLRITSNLGRTEYTRQKERTGNNIYSMGIMDWKQMKVRGIYKEMHWRKIN